MPFEQRSIVEARGEFCRLAMSPGGNIRELCRRFAVSPETAYKWLARFKADGDAGLVDRSHRPLASPSRTAERIEARVLGVRGEHPAWGGRKIRKVLENEGLERAPAASTITAIVRRHGLLNGPGAGEARAFRRFEHEAPNDLWQMDFKGHVALAQGRCHPLTMLDDHSRYCLELGACANEQTLTVRERMTSVFRRHGLPRRILADNGSPWGTAGSGQRHTPLTVWLLDLEVGVGHGRPYHPQTQGKEERFHRTLKAEVLGERTFDSLAKAQEAFDAWREVYNVKRPHQAIGMATPVSRYRMSPRTMPQTISPPDYEPGIPTRKVDAGGWINFKGRPINCPKAFAGRRLALRATTADGVFDLCYRRHVLGQVDLTQNIVKPVHHLPEQASTLSPV